MQMQMQINNSKNSFVQVLLKPGISGRCVDDETIKITPFYCCISLTVAQHTAETKFYPSAPRKKYFGTELLCKSFFSVYFIRYIS